MTKVDAVGFVPLMPDLKREMESLECAYIFGYMWLNRNSHNQFDESVNSLPLRLDLANSTCRKWLKWLCDNEYLVDLTPDLERQPHTYQLTDKVDLGWTITIEISAQPRRRHSRYTAKGGYPPNGYAHSRQTAIHHSRQTANMNHDHDMHDDDLEKVLLLWGQLGFDEASLPKMLESWEADLEVGAVECLGRCLTMWLAALEADEIPDTWGHGLLYQKIKDGEAPPAVAKKMTFGDEARAAMELQQQQQNQDDQDGEEE